MTNESGVELQNWRKAMEAAVWSSEVEAATDALLGITYNDPDRVYVESILLKCLSVECDRQVRSLAVTCIGHVARIYRSVGRDVLRKLDELLDDPDLSGVAEDALDDVKSFVVS
ncbi:hypothetical protein [Allokutzneria sp. NRRL B-24872]|uniref:hypothetical protein n=1 Tax=Allokutzneria sp. NRRL B-24872 TaxID=1137961 RepID=UPI001177A8AF|nr:hypothetical protein [Allokutzneria sp. NRRL B-24872]